MPFVSHRILSAKGMKMSEAKTLLSKRIQNLRHATGLTQERLAEKAGLSLKHLGEIERGRGNPTLSSLDRLAKALDVSLSEMFDYQHEKMSPEELETELNLMVRHANDKERRLFYRLLRSIVK